MKIMKIMKLASFMSVFFMCLVSMGAETNTQFRWLNSAANNLIDENDVNIVSGGATILTYLSSDNAIGFDPNNPLSTTYGNDFFYAGLKNSLAGKLTTSYMTGVDPEDYHGYYAYAVILNLSYTTFTNTYASDVTQVPLGTHYVVTSIFGGLTDISPAGPPGTPDTFNPGIVLKTTPMLIPEPGTMGLLGLGAIGTFLIRRKKRMA